MWPGRREAMWWVHWRQLGAEHLFPAMWSLSSELQLRGRLPGTKRVEMGASREPQGALVSCTCHREDTAGWGPPESPKPPARAESGLPALGTGRRLHGDPSAGPGHGRTDTSCPPTRTRRHIGRGSPLICACCHCRGGRVLWGGVNTGRV